VLYVGLKASVKKAQGSELKAGDVAELFMEGESTAELGETPLGPVWPGWRAVMPVQVVRALIKELPEGTKIQMIGERKCMVQGVPAKRKKRPLTWLKTAAIALLLFFGGGLTLMNFHADVNMPGVHRMIASLVTGQEDAGVMWISIPYSIGIGLGVVFFTGFGRRRAGPNLLELEEQEYRTKVDQYLQKKETGETGDG
jgi:stage V sporulation protein AA